MRPATWNTRSAKPRSSAASSAELSAGESSAATLQGVRWDGCYGRGERTTFAIGDIHGCFEELRSLLAFCRKSAGDIPHDFLFLGDYVDRGPASDQVIAYLIREQARSSSRVRCLLGNHIRCFALPRIGIAPMLTSFSGGRTAARRHWMPTT